MQTSFLALSKPIIAEVVSGRCTVEKGKSLLKINSDIVVNLKVRERLDLWNKLISSRDLVYDSSTEKEFTRLCQ